MANDSKVLWKANSSCHDWRGDAPLRRLIEHALALGLIGSATWVKPAAAAERKPATLPSGPELTDRLLAMAVPTDGVIEVSAGSNDPPPWEIFWNTYPVDPEYGVLGINTLWFTFDRACVVDRIQSDRLLESFIATHTPADTEYALIHPYEHWSDFADRHYERPVTIAPMFRGVYWANYLGGKSLHEFELDRLADLTCQQLYWQDTAGLFFVTAPELAAADSRAAEAEMLRLNKYFRAALRPDSPWAP